MTIESPPPKAPAAPPAAVRRRLLARIVAHRGAAAWVIALGAVAGAFAAVSVGAVVPVFHVLLSGDEEPFAALRARGGNSAALADFLASHLGDDRFNALAVVVLALVISTLVAALAGFLHDVVAATLSQRIQTELAEDLFDRLTGHDERTLRRVGMGDLTARFTYDLDMAGKAADTFLNTLVVEPFTCLFYFALAITLSWKLTLAAVVTVPVMLVLARRLGRRTRSSAEGMLAKRSALLSRVHETLAGLPIVQVYGQEERERRRFRDLTSRVRAWGRKLARLEALNSPALEVAGVLALAPVLLYGGHLVLRTGELTAAEFLGVFVALISFYAPLRKSIGASNRLQGGIAGASRIFATMDLVSEVVETRNAGPLPPLGREIAWNNVVVTYADGRTALRGVSVRAPAGQTTAIVGPSGAGKTTLLLTVPRLVDPTSGTVRLDGRDLREGTLTSVRSRVALVTQEPRLFGGTLGENIAYAKPAATRDEIDRAAKVARVDEIVARLPLGYDTVLDEGGHGLSGGERQRIAIARAVLRDPEILLLDEPTSALDSENERLVRTALAELSRGRTTIVVAHRAETVLAADHVIVLRDGAVECEGTPAEVAKRSPTFRELFGGAS